MIREFDFIDILAQRFGTQGSGLDRGIGDDCAHLEIPDDTIQLITADMLTHGVHFSDRFMKWEDIGYRSVAVNLSDLAASGANPDHPILLLLSMAVPPEMEKDQLIFFIDGVAECSGNYNALVAGGDSTWTHGPFSVSITALGYTKKPVARDGALPGHRLCIFGNVGAAGCGFDILETGKKTDGKEILTQAFLRPEPLLKIGYALASSGIVTAMIDVSDGVLADAGHIAAQSGCDAEIEIRDLSIPEAVFDAMPEDRALETAAAFGDDYALLASVPENRLKEAENLANRMSIPFCSAGKFIEGSGKVNPYLDGNPYTVLKSGYQHRLGR